MTELPHILPDINKYMISTVLISDKRDLKPGENLQEKYERKIVDFEKSCERSIIETLSKLYIRSMVKTDRYSLPFKNEIVVTLNGESYLNGPYEFYRVAKIIAKELLEKNVYKLRFYLYVNLLAGTNFLTAFGKVEYRFRYYKQIPAWSK